MDTNIRDLKANLSGVIRRVLVGETITVCVHRRPVAQFVPIAKRGGSDELARIPGIVWKGGKPKGLRSGKILPRGVLLSDWVIEDRR